MLTPTPSPTPSDNGGQRRRRSSHGGSPSLPALSPAVNWSSVGPGADAAAASALGGGHAHESPDTAGGGGGGSDDDDDFSPASERQHFNLKTHAGDLENHAASSSHSWHHHHAAHTPNNSNNRGFRFLPNRPSPLVLVVLLLNALILGGLIVLTIHYLNAQSTHASRGTFSILGADHAGDTAQHITQQLSAEQQADAAVLLVPPPSAAPQVFFRFPRPPAGSPTSSFFVTAIPNGGAGVGHQFGPRHTHTHTYACNDRATGIDRLRFGGGVVLTLLCFVCLRLFVCLSVCLSLGEWLYGPLLAARHNLTYAHTGFMMKSIRWTRFLGFAEGEDSVEDLEVRFAHEPGLSDLGGTGGASGPGSSSSIHAVTRSQHENSLEDSATWVPGVLAAFRAQSEARWDTLRSEGFELARPNAAQAALAPHLTRPLLVRFDQVHVPHHSVICDQPEMYRILRQKYCAARVRNPVRADLYAEERAKDGGLNYTVVALHLRCGDSCYNPYRATSFDSVAATALRLHALLTVLDPGRPISFHLFSQGPANNTAEAHFQPLLQKLSGLKVTPHWTLGSSMVLHHLVRADVLVGAQSSFSWLASLLQYGVSLAPLTSCAHSVKYDKQTGAFDEEQFNREYRHAQDKLPRYRFGSMQDCVNIQRHDQV